MTERTPVCNSIQKGKQLATLKKSARFEWPRSWALNLSIAVVVGFLYSLLVMGPRPLNPHDIDWLTLDGAQHEIAWELFRQDPTLHWPITFTDRIGYPKGEPMALLDPDPLIAVLLKPFSPLLPQPFQYQGLEVVLICVLQFFFALLIFRSLLGSDPYAVALPSLFFLLSPPLCWRFIGHYAMDNHWLLLACLLLLLATQRQKPISIRRFVGCAVLLEGLAVAVNPYLTLQVVILIGATLVALVWQHKVSALRAVGAVFVLAVTGYLVASAFGLIIHGGRGYAAGGYRSFSLNFLGPIDPQDQGSLLLPEMPKLWTQYEGYNYLGLGIILLAIAGLVLWPLRRHAFPRLDRRVCAPVIGACILLWLLALSTKFTFGTHTILDLDPHEKLTPYLDALRASGRLFWASYYVLVGSILLVIYYSLPRRWATLLVFSALVVQFADTQNLRHWVHTEVNKRHPSPLRSSIWSTLGRYHQNLIVMPPWQCSNGTSSPGGRDGYRTFGFLAFSQHMRINSFYAARYTEVNRDWQCGKAVSDLSNRPLSPSAAYIVTPLLAQEIAKGPTGPGKCHDLDHLILCSTKTDFGLSPILASPLELLKTAIDDPSFEDSGLSSWSTWQNVNASVTTARSHDGSQSLVESGGAGSVYEDVTDLEPGRTYVVSAWVSGSADVTATAQIAVSDSGANAATFSGSVTPHDSWQLVSQSVTVSDAGRLRIHLFRNEGRGSVYWDDVHIYLSKLRPLQSGNPQTNTENRLEVGDRVDFTSAEAFGYTRKGWSGPERGWGDWTIGPESELVFNLENYHRTHPFVLDAELHAFVVPGHSSFHTDVLANGMKIATWHMSIADRDPIHRQATIPVSVLKGDVLRITFENSDPRSPSEFSNSTDGRKLSIALRSLTLR